LAGREYAFADKGYKCSWPASAAISHYLASLHHISASLLSATDKVSARRSPFKLDQARHHRHSPLFTMVFIPFRPFGVCCTWMFERIRFCLFTLNAQQHLPLGRVLARMQLWATLARVGTVSE